MDTMYIAGKIVEDLDWILKFRHFWEKLDADDKDIVIENIARSLDESFECLDQVVVNENLY
jgi:hypothetical protein